MMANKINSIHKVFLMICGKNISNSHVRQSELSFNLNIQPCLFVCD